MTATTNPLVPLIGRVLLAALFLFGAFGKFQNLAGTAGYFGRLGLPAPEMLVWAVVGIEFIGAVLIVIGWQTRWVAWAMAIFTVATALIGHKFWAVDPAQLNSQLTQFLKNLAIAGGFVLLAFSGPGSLSVDRK